MKIRACFLALALSASTLTAQGSWEVVGTGIEYRKFTLGHPNNVFVTRMDRANSLVTLESSIAQGKWIGGKETVSGMFNRYEQTINFWDPSWGSRSDVVVAINGDFYNVNTGVPTSGQIHSGWYAKRFSKLTGGSGFAWKMDRSAFVGRCVNHPGNKQFVTYVATGATQKFQKINGARGSDQLVIYTPQYDSDTNTDSTGVEVLVELAKPLLIEPTPAMVTGVVRKIRDGQGSTRIPFDHVVLSAKGTARSTLLANVSVGDTIGISQELKHYEQDCSTKLNTLDWTKTYAAVGGSFVFLEDGAIPSFTDPGATARHPRTAVCYNASYIYFIVVDGRNPGVSVGMTMAELGAFSRDTLGADWCINQDGGGSSTMVVNGVVKNNPSDGGQRWVANGMMMVEVEPIEQSTAFAPSDPVTTAASTSVRLGPGTNYAVAATVAGNTAGVVLDHANDLEGVLATGSYWWKVDLAGTVGWVTESSLTDGDLPPSASIVSPEEGSVVSGNINIQVEATDDRDAEGSLTVDVRIDGGAWQATTYNAASGYYETSWDASAAGDGPHTIEGRATDTAQQTSSIHLVNVTVGESNPPPAPTGLDPDNGVTITTSSVTLSCDPVTGATGYEFEIGYSSEGTWKYYYTYSTTGPQTKFWPYYDDIPYRWRVRAENAHGWGSWSQWAHFDFGDVGGDPLPPAPTGLSPDNVNLTAKPVSLSCDPVTGATGYEFEIGYSSAGTWKYYYTYATTANSKAFWPYYPDTSYRWRVRAKNSVGWGSWSQWAHFDFGNVGGDTPTGLSPDNVTLTGSSVTLSCNPVAGATQYQFEIWYLSAGIWKYYYTYTTTTNSRKFWPSLHGTSYQWRVRAGSSSGWGPWSTWATFGFN